MATQLDRGNNLTIQIDVQSAQDRSSDLIALGI